MYLRASSFWRKSKSILIITCDQGGRGLLTQRDWFYYLPFAPDISFFHGDFSCKWQPEHVNQENAEYFGKKLIFLVNDDEIHLSACWNSLGFNLTNLPWWNLDIFAKIERKLELLTSWDRVELWWAMILKAIPHLILKKAHLITCSPRIISY